MALLQRCDRCHKTTDNFDSIDDPPSGWVNRTMPVRGSAGARSDTTTLLCNTCDDSLYRWVNSPDPQAADA